MLEILTCKLGGQDMSQMQTIPNLTSTVVDIIMFAIPVILIILGMIDLGKAVTSNDEKQMKEAQKTLIKRVIYAVLILFITALVQFVFSALAPKDSSETAEGAETTETTSGNISGCINCFINGEC